MTRKKVMLIVIVLVLLSTTGIVFSSKGYALGKSITTRGIVTSVTTPEFDYKATKIQETSIYLKWGSVL